MLISRDSHTPPRPLPSCAWHGMATPRKRAAIQPALDDPPDVLPFFPLRLPRLSTRNVLLPPKRNPHRPLDGLTSLLALPAPDDLTPARLHSTHHVLPLRDH